MEYRMEHDSMGDVRVPADRYWGAQTQRSFENFPIGQGREPMPTEIIHAFGILKKAAAITNARLCPTAMTAEKCGAICAAAMKLSPESWQTTFRLSSGRPAPARRRT